MQNAAFLKGPHPVVIIGGGPVGLATAIALHQAGLSSVVLEKRAYPVDKVCGEGIMPPGIDALKRLGVFQNISDDMRRPFVGVKYFNANGAEAFGQFPNAPGFGVRRTYLSRALFQSVEKAESISLVERAIVKKIERCNHEWHVMIVRDQEERLLKTKLLIGADGMRSFVRDALHLQGEPPTKMKRYGARQHFQISPWSSFVEVYWGNGIEAYVTPSGSDRVEVAFLWERDAQRALFRGKTGVDQFLDHFPPLKTRLQNAIPSSELKGIGPLAVRAKTSVEDGLILIGDAYGYMDGITGEGISVGLEQALMIGQKLPACIREERLQKADLKQIGATIKKLFQKSVFTTKLALVLSRHSLLRNLAIAGLSRSPTLFRAFLEVNMGERQLWQLPLKGVLQALWGGMRSLMLYKREKPAGKNDAKAAATQRTQAG